MVLNTHERSGKEPLNDHFRNKTPGHETARRHSRRATPIAFHRFDIAYAVLWQRLHPRLSLTEAGRSLTEGSEILTSILDEATSGLPVFGTASRLLAAAGKSVRRWQMVRQDETLQELDQLQLPQLMDAVTYLFAAELRQAGRDVVMFVDAYEALLGGAPAGWQDAAVDAWLRDLLAQLDESLVVVASREPLAWSRYAPEWSRIIRTVPVEGLPLDARLELLHALGVEDGSLVQSIAVGSAGVPFFLHLAHDTRSSRGSVVSPQAILERFLRHVDPVAVRMLELLSPTRFFDAELFRVVAEAYGMPSHEPAWRSITGYSFVQPADPYGVRLHQLMASTLRQGLGQQRTLALHHLLHEAWRDRATALMAGPEFAASLREAAYHGLRGQDLDPPDLLDYADRIRAAAAATGVRGVVADLDEYRAENDNSALRQLALCLRAEAEILRGDATAVATLTADLPVRPPADEVQARLAIAAAHAHRILGDTADALRRFDVVRRGHRGPARLDAGLWLADLHMAQGRFRDAVAAAAEVEEACGDERPELCGDVARLVHLPYRFAFDFDAARRHLQRARQAYEAAGSTVALANVMINELELAALTTSEDLTNSALAAIERQRELGAEHEVGKGYSALGLARIARGDLGGAEHALNEAVAALERAGYRSGRARAELYRAALAGRRGDDEGAERAARWALSELQAAEVYPTLIITAVRLLERLGRPDAGLANLAEQAMRQLRLPDGITDLDERIGAVLERLLGDHLSVRREQALAQGDAASGFYNINVRSGDDLVRVPLSEANVMDLRVWPEHLVLAAAGRHLDAVPRLRAASISPAVQVHEFVHGTLLDRLAPRGTAVPEGVVDQLAELLAALRVVPRTELPSLPAGWPDDGQSDRFAAQLSAVTRKAYRVHLPEFGQLWRELGFPDDPIEAVDWSTLRSRPFALLHADVHRKNVIIRASGRCVVLDWELALWGDPVYDLAVHLHKMGYLPTEDVAAREAWQQWQTFEMLDGWVEDTETYLRHERIKSAVVDSVRYAKVLRSGKATPARTWALVDSLVAKLRAAKAVWGDPQPVPRDRVLRALDRYG
jgi:aminoglycoside phosphotransferase (APT) family kinase protein